jgi:hypothetical protein
MKKIVFLTTLILLASLAVTAFAIQEQMGVEATATAQKTTATPVAAQISNVQKTALKATLRNYFSTVIHGYGIGFTEENYIIAKWYVTNVRTLNRANINAIIRQAKQGNETDWDAVRERVREALVSVYTTIKKGRISIEGGNYILTSIFVTNESMTADIREIPDYESCQELVEFDAEMCEENSDKVGEIAISKRTKPQQEIAGEPRVWAGTLTFNDVRYTFVTFAYPR